MAFNLFKKKEPASAKPAKREDASTPAAPAVSPAIQDTSGAYRVLRSAHVSERASYLMGMNQYVFVVTDKATKPEIKKQIEKRYHVKVLAVRIVRLPGKMKQIGRRQGFRPGIKKAIIRLAEGDVIEQAKP